MAQFFATVLPGLEHVLKDEIREKIADGAFLSIERGKVYFASDLPPEALKALRTADNLYRLIHRFEVGPHKIHLADIEREIYRCEPIRGELNFGAIGFKVNASRAGNHAYSRFDAAEAAARGIARRDSRWRQVSGGLHEMEFRLDVHHREAVFGMKLTDAKFRYRGEERKFTSAALRPTVAHALVRISNPEPADVFVDPCCGSGTILAERLEYPYGRIEGGDVSLEAVAASKENIGALERVSVRRWDARQLPIASGRIDKIVTNLPFGRQIAANEDIPSLYGDLLREMRRVLKKNGTIFCLTSADEALMQAAERAHFRLGIEATLHLKGLRPTLFSLRKP